MRGYQHASYNFLNKINKFFTTVIDSLLSYRNFKE